MNEIEKMYENVGIKKQYCGWLDMGDLDCQMQYVRCNSINEYTEAVFSSRFGETEEEPELKYPEFTAEKQLELLKWLCTEENYISIIVDSGLWKLNYHREFYSYDNPNAIKGRSKLSFEESLANLINNLWQDLTEEERKQIKDILK